jgi:hypothetical protein
MSPTQPEVTGRKRATRRRSPFAYDIPEAGALIGLSRNAAYEAAKRGEIPTVQMGRLKKVPRVPFDRMFGIDSEI